MKKLIIAATAVFFLISAGRAYAGPDDEIVHFPDSLFKHFLVHYQYIWEGFPRIDKNRDGEIQVSEAAEYNSWLIISEYDYSSFEGIRAFTSLEEISIKSDIGFIDLENMESLREVTIEADIDSVSVAGCKKLEEFRVRYSKCKKISVQGCENLLQISVSLKDKQLREIHGLSTCENLAVLVIIGSEIKNVDIENLEYLERFATRNNSIHTLDLSEKKHLLYCNIEEPNLQNFNLQNNNNQNLEFVEVDNCPNLNCIQVDDPEYSEAMWRNGDTTKFKFDEHLFFSTDCKSNIEEGVDEIAIFPNPGEDFIEIERTNLDATDILIYDLNGNLKLNWWFEKNQKRVRIDISELTPGVYYTVFNQKSYKFIKQ